MSTVFTSGQLLGKLISFYLPGCSPFLQLFMKITNGYLFLYSNIYLLSEEQPRKYNMTTGTYVSEQL